MLITRPNRSGIKYDFHVSKITREKYGFEESLFSINGDLIVANFYQARILAEKINSIRKDEQDMQQVTAGQINALGILHEIYHYMMRHYEENENPNVFSRAVNNIKNSIGENDLQKILIGYINQFPPGDVFRGIITPEEYLNGNTGNKPNTEIILEELIILHLENNNPASVSLEELYSDKPLIDTTAYLNLIDAAEKFFITEKPFGPDNLPLTQFLREPIKNNPYNLEAQLDYLREKWGVFIYIKFYDRLLSSKDLLHEDYKLFIHHGGGEKSTPPVPVYKFDAEFFESIKAKIAAGEQLTPEESQFYYAETEQFTEDIDWMPKVVMIAKNTFVWLDQLSKKYQREIKTLFDIPDEELDNLARWNFTALWLIGIWERSSASKKIKHYTGNPDAVSSAYSLYDYVVANEIGGEEAFQNLKERCWQRGIRLSSDMVPNHTGIYSKWVVEKPDYFIQTDVPPYPGYTFNGPNLSDDPRVEIRIEDKYYNHTDAAVVFQRRDAYTGDIKYIYHGNDGTHMPWNDTAQLNLLKPEVRESLIQTILHVARKTPIIRFDAAMTLAKKHYQRLWFPQPGTGGAVPSRSDYAMTRSAFDDAMPVEFWREVVDRINSEMPQTLLLAEAFWLMESYFVRTLGMHRVYNSAFMHMMMKEENAKYRELVKNTLEFNPEILKRYVNFMSNPDEETAVNQFGKGDKYFGVCVLMITMPGLPMFAHGQIEGFSEKYGMEYKRAYYDEFIDENLVHRHEAEIFPLAAKRYLFSQVKNFEMYDFIDNNGNVNENVFAYSNKTGDEKALVIYNNSYEECAGTINYSVQKTYQSGNLITKKIADALGIRNDNLFFYIYKDHRTKLEYISSGKDIHDFGFYVPLQGYEYKIFMEFREIFDTTGVYRQISQSLYGRGVKSIERLKEELQFNMVHQSLRNLLSIDHFKKFESYCFPASGNETDQKSFEEIINSAEDFIDEINSVIPVPVNKEIAISKIKDEMNAIREFSSLMRKQSLRKRKSKWYTNAESKIGTFNNGKEKRELFFPLLVLKNTFSVMNTSDDQKNLNMVDHLHLENILFENLKGFGHKEHNIKEEINLLKILTADDELYNSERVNLKSEFPDESIKTKKSASPKPKKILRAEFLTNIIFKLNENDNYLRVNEHNGIIYYHKENFENLIDWICSLEIIEDAIRYLVLKDSIEQKRKRTAKQAVELKESDKLKKNISAFATQLTKDVEFFERLKSLSADSKYQVEELKKLAAAKKSSKSDSSRKTVVRSARKKNV